MFLYTWKKRLNNKYKKRVSYRYQIFFKKSKYSFLEHFKYKMCFFCTFINPIQSGVGLLNPPPFRFFALAHLILELHHGALGTFPKKHREAKIFF